MWFRKQPAEARLDKELRYHFEKLVRDSIAAGMDPEEARRRARLEFGGVEQIKEECRDVRGHWVEDLVKDFRYTARTLRRSPGFLAVAVLSLGLGIGANTTVYSVIHAVLLRSLPYPEPDRLVRVEGAGSGSDITMPQLLFWKEHAASFTSAAGNQGAFDRILTSGEKTLWITAMPVSADFLRTLGVAPALGRDLQPDEMRPGGPLAVVLSHDLWQRAFSGDPKAVGRLVSIDNASYTVAGVLPSNFWFPTAADALVPLRFTGSVGDLGLNTEMVARLRPGVGLAQARAEMAVLSKTFRDTHRDLDDLRPLTVTSYRDRLVYDVRANLLLLFSAVCLLLLIACFNLASLLLARLAGRQKEIAMRIALGCSRGRLLRQFLIENTILTMLGGLAGLVGARVSLDTLVASIPFHLPASAPITLDTPVLLFALAIAFATGMAFSVAPILAASRLDLQETLKAGGRAGGAAVRQRTRSVLVVSEVALSVTLLVAAGLLIETLYRMHREQLGFDPQGVMTFATPSTAVQRNNSAAVHAFEKTLLERLRALPSVRNAAAASVLPLTSQSNFPTEHAGHPDQDIGGMEIRIVTPSYFETMRIPIALGRPLSESDTSASPPVILVNETVARKWWGQNSPLGDQVVVGRYRGRDIGGGGEPPRAVVGVVADTKSVYLKMPSRPTVYLPASQAAWYDFGMNWVVRGNLSAEQLRALVADIDPRQRVERVRSMEEIVASTTADSRFNAWLFGSFAALALALAAIGVYGLLAFSVARRTAEIGTRMALGASRMEVLHLVLKQGVTLVLIGLVLGLAGALAVSRSLASLLFGVRSTDPASFVSVAALMLFIGLLASYFPARRATRVDPMVALRDE